MDQAVFASCADESAPFVTVTRFLLQYLSDNKRNPDSDKCYFPASDKHNETIPKIRETQIENSDSEKLLGKKIESPLTTTPDVKLIP